MENISTKFEKAQTEFIKSNASEKSVENLYDLIYSLKEIEQRNFYEDYFLAEAYNLVGKYIYASKIINKRLVENLKEVEIKKLKELQQKIDNLDFWNVKKYRDLRDAKIIKSPTKLNLEDFIISKDKMEYCIGISNKINSIVIINKNVIIEDRLFNEDINVAFSQKEPTNSLLVKLVEYIEWIGQIKDELLNFYNNDFFGHRKLNNVGQKWYDGLNIADLSIYIDNEDNFETEITAQDYLQNDFGFRLEFENKNFKNIEYDPAL